MCRCASALGVVLVTMSLTLMYYTGTRIDRFQLATILAAGGVRMGCDTMDAIRAYGDGGAQNAAKHLLCVLGVWSIGVLYTTMILLLPISAGLRGAIVWESQRFLSIMAIVQMCIGFTLWSLTLSDEFEFSLF